MPTKPAYHHGDLPNALRRVTAELLAERGAAGFSLREAARRSGVTHTAVTHHFGGVQGLLTAVAVEGLELLVAETSAAADVADPVEALARVGQAYVRVGSRHRGHCAVMFRIDLVDHEDPTWEAAAGAAYDVLHRVVARLAAERNPDLDVRAAAGLAWAAVQGILDLAPALAVKTAGEDAEPLPLDVLAERLTTVLATGLAAG
jgi:AcrR family transcriptional regulator